MFFLFCNLCFSFGFGAVHRADCPRTHVLAYTAYPSDFFGVLKLYPVSWVCAFFLFCNFCFSFGFGAVHRADCPRTHVLAYTPYPSDFFWECCFSLWFGGGLSTTKTSSPHRTNSAAAGSLTAILCFFTRAKFCTRDFEDENRCETLLWSKCACFLDALLWTVRFSRGF